jgi:hypothetical protein
VRGRGGCRWVGGPGSNRSSPALQRAGSRAHADLAGGKPARDQPGGWVGGWGGPPGDWLEGWAKRSGGLLQLPTHGVVASRHALAVPPFRRGFADTLPCARPVHGVAGLHDTQRYDECTACADSGCDGLLPQAREPSELNPTSAVDGKTTSRASGCRLGRVRVAHELVRITTSPRH